MKKYFFLAGWLLLVFGSVHAQPRPGPNPNQSDGSPRDTVDKDPQRGRLEITAAPVVPPAGRTHVIVVNTDGSFTPARVEIFSGDTVEWKFSARGTAIIPVALGAQGLPDCAHPLPYESSNPNDFTGPMPRAASGIFSLSPEEAPYATEDDTWRSPNIAGVFIRPRWDDVHVGPNQFNWTQIDAEIERAVRNGKLFSIGFKAGVKGTPTWIFDPAKTDAVVTRLDFGYRSEGRPAYYGSPADANYRRHYSDLLRAFAAHLRANNAHYRALAYIKPSGANLHTHENRLPNETTEQLKTWATLGRYTPSALYDFYREQEALLAAEFTGKDLGYALIQDGFPQINDQGEYLGQPTPPKDSLPTGALQTETILDQGRLAYGLRFVVAHNGLMKKPEFCPGSGTHPILVDPRFRYVGSGCPNRWVLEQAVLGQITGFQTTNDLLDRSDVDSALQNAWDNSDGIYVELYERNVQQVDAGGVLPSGNTLGQWNERFHTRRRANFPQLPDPFPATHRHRFTRTVTTSGVQELHFVNGSGCAAGARASHGTIAILPDLSFTTTTLGADNSVQLILTVARAGALRVEYSENLTTWTLLELRDTIGGTERVTVNATASPARFYRASLR